MFVGASAGRVLADRRGKRGVDQEQPAECWLTEEESEVFTRNSRQSVG